MRVLVTGNAGFIGFHVARALLARGDEVVGFDSVNDYYDPQLKEARLAILAEEGGDAYRFVRANLADRAAVEACFSAERFDRVINLAAQAGVRHSLDHPYSYVESNLVGFLNILEGCRHARIAHLTYASSSSVYGANTAMPLSEHAIADHPLQLYAATKRSNELMAHAYSSLFAIPTTGLRFFTVYGPWGRPDMALFKFTSAILAGEPVTVYNYGNHNRDFTYIDDIVEGVIRASDAVARPNPGWDGKHPDPASSRAPFRLYNIGNSTPVRLGDYISAIEARLGRTAKRELLPMQIGDVPDTHADIGDLVAELGYRPKVSVEDGIGRFVEWYLAYYGVNATAG